MTTTPATISVSRGGRSQSSVHAGDPVGEVSKLLRLAYASDLTVSIQLSENRGLLLVALEAGYAFVGLETSGAVYQYVADETALGTEQFVIGGQSAAIDRRYVLAIPEAIQLLTTCLAGPNPSAANTWERQRLLSDLGWPGGVFGAASFALSRPRVLQLLASVGSESFFQAIALRLGWLGDSAFFICAQMAFMDWLGGNNGIVVGSLSLRESWNVSGWGWSYSYTGGWWRVTFYGIPIPYVCHPKTACTPSRLPMWDPGNDRFLTVNSHPCAVSVGASAAPAGLL